MKQEAPLLSISLLVSNRMETVRRCLDSLKPIMEQLPCELILVNTGTKSGIEEILREYTERVIPFSWCNDFSKARNVGLQEAKGEWFLYIDDDEWFVEISELIEFFQSGEYRKYGYANYIQRNFFDPEYETYADNWVSRMIRLEPDTHFRSRIHEYLYPAYGEGKNLRVIANHSGYVYLTEEDRRKRFARNAPLLEQMMKEEPDNLRWGIQLAQEYYTVEEWIDLENICRSALQNDLYTEQAIMERLACTFYAGIAEALIGQGKYEAALDEIKRAQRKNDCSPLGIAYLLLLQGICYLHRGDWKLAQSSIRQYLESETKITADAQQYAIWQEALIADGAFDSISKKKAYSVLLACHLAEGNEKEVLRLFTLLGWGQKAIYVFPPLMPILLEETTKQYCKTYMTTIWTAIWNNEKLYEVMVQENRRLWKCKSNERRCVLKENYTEQTYKFLKNYYKEDVLQKYPKLLPQIGQRAIGLIDAIAGEDRIWQKGN